jgi:cellulose synthase/poly-beta-1,6-N-acetylglucosamine synthase-like glycosyltransferase
LDITPFEFAFLVLYGTLLVLLSIYGGHRYYLAWLYKRHKQNPWIPKSTFETLPRVTVQLPMYNEMFVAERLIDATCLIRYPRDRFQVQVLDDSTDGTTEIAQRCVDKWKAAGIDIELIHRVDRSGFKAGALAKGLDTSTGEFVAVFDADFVPQPDFFERTIQFFTDARIGMVQVRWDHLNRDFNLLTRAQSVMLDGHFIIEHTARNRSGRFFNFNGTAGVWRRATIEDAGGWQHDTLTEDLDLSYRSQINGWQFVFLPDVLAPAEVPVEMNSFKSQQHRWAKGSIQTARKLLPRIWNSKLPLATKAESFFHLTNNLAYLLMVVLCLIMPVSIAIRYKLQVPWLMWLDLPAFLLSTLSIGYFYYVCQREAGVSRFDALKYLPVVLSVGIGMCINNTKAVIEALIGHQSGFTRTPKYGVVKSTDSSWKTRTAYHRRYDWTPVVELALALWFTYAVYASIEYGAWMAFPFMLMFQFGFTYMSVMSLWQTKQRLAQGI